MVTTVLLGNASTQKIAFMSTYVGIGTTTPGRPLEIASTSGQTQQVMVQGANGNQAIEIHAASSSANDPGTFRGTHAQGTFAIPTATGASYALAAFVGGGYDNAGTPARTGNNAAIKLWSAEAFTTAAQGTYITIETTPTGSVTRAERVRIDASGYVGIGATPDRTLVINTANNALTAGTPSVLIYGQQNKERIEIQSFANGGTADAAYQGIGANGTVASPTASSSGQDLVVLGGGGYDNAGTPARSSNKALIRLQANEAWTTAAQGTAILFETTAATTTTRAQRFQIDSAGLTSTVPNLGPAGAATAGNVTYSFSGDTNSGWYSVGADDVGCSTGGTLRFDISTTAITSTIAHLGPNGAATAGNVTYSFSGDTDNGMFLATTNAIGWSTAGIERTRMTAAGGTQWGGGTAVNATNGPLTSGAVAASVANNGTYTISTTGFLGFLFIVTSEGHTAIFALQGALNATTELFDTNATFSNASGTATSNNVYRSGTNYLIENKRGSTLNYSFFGIAAQGASGTLN